MKKVLAILLVIIPFLGLSQVNIKITVDNRQDGMCHLYRYRGSKMSLADSAYCRNGKLRFTHLKDYPQGIYLLTDSQRMPITEIMIGEDQIFSIKIKDNESSQSVKVHRSKDNKLFFKLMKREREHNMLVHTVSGNQNTIDSLNQDILLYEESLLNKRTGTFFKLFVNSMKRHDKEHYWDDFRLDDARILTYPLIDKRLDEYFNRCLEPKAELINGEIDKLIAKTGDCVEVRDYLLWYFYKKYYSPDYMHLDDVYIHLVDEYFLKLEMDNMTESMMNMMADRANYLENLKIGARFPDLGGLYGIDASYVAVFFYEEGCPKCREERRSLDVVQKNHPEMVIFPVEVKSSIVDNLLMVYDIQTTPTIYLVDKQKKIIGKRINFEQVEQILNMDRK